MHTPQSYTLNEASRASWPLQTFNQHASYASIDMRLISHVFQRTGGCIVVVFMRYMFQSAPPAHASPLTVGQTCAAVGCKWTGRRCREHAVNLCANWRVRSITFGIVTKLH